MDQNIQICKRCLYSNLHPLGITFNTEGVCSGCEIFEEKNPKKLETKIVFKYLRKKILLTGNSGG